MKIKRLFICFFLFQFSFVLFSQQIANTSERIKKSDSLYRLTNQRLSVVDFDKADDIPLLFIQLPDIGKTIDSLELSFRENAHQISGDSSISAGTIALLRKRFDSIQIAVEEKMRKIDLVMYEAGLQSLGMHDTTSAIRFFKKSTAYNPSYSPAWYQLVKINNRTSTIVAASNYLSDALKFIDTITNTYNAKLWKQCTEEVFGVFLLANKQMIVSEDYFKALDQLNQISLFCNIYKVSNCADSVRYYVQLAKTGMFQSYIKIARRAIYNKRFEMAREYVSKSEKYYMENTLDINAGNLLKEISDYLADELLKSEVKKSRPSFADRKENSHRKKNQTNRRKRSKVAIGKDVELNAAKRSAVHVLKDTATGWFPRKEQKDSILQIIRMAYYLAWKNETDSAQTIYQKTIENLARLQLAKDATVQLAVNELKIRIDEQKKFNAIAIFQNYLNQSINYFNRKKYPESEEFLTKAENWYHNNEIWGLNDSLLSLCKSKYKDVYAFENGKRLMYDHLKSGNHDLFLNQYEEVRLLNKLIFSAGIDTELILLDSILKLQTDPELIKKSIIKALQGAHEKSALYRLSLLKNIAYPSKLCSQEQKLTAQHIAEKDFKPGDSGRQVLKRLQLEGTWYKTFRKEYMRKYQELSKSSTHEKAIINQ